MRKEKILEDEGLSVAEGEMRRGALRRKKRCWGMEDSRVEDEGRGME